MEKRTQLERLTIAESLLVSVMHELTEGKSEGALMQTAVNVQTEANRIVWKLNDMREKSDTFERFI